MRYHTRKRMSHVQMLVCARPGACMCSDVLHTGEMYTLITDLLCYEL